MKRTQTHCLQGHSLIDKTNVYLNGHGYRQCRRCEKQRDELTKRGYPGRLPRITCDKGHPWIPENIVRTGALIKRLSCKICRYDANERFAIKRNSKRRAHTSQIKTASNSLRFIAQESRRRKALQIIMSSKRRMILEHKNTHPCSECGEADPRCLDFHHRDESTKEFNLSEHKGRSASEVEKEIQKCVMLCANCHRKEHINEEYADLVPEDVLWWRLNNGYRPDIESIMMSPSRYKEDL